MINKKTIIAIIPARGGSKGLHRKNIRELGGKPLMSYTIKAALGCGYVDQCFVSTEDKKIKKTSESCGARVIDRPRHLAGDFVSCEAVVSHVLSVLKRNGNLPDYFVLLPPTSPLRNKRHLKEAILNFISSNSNSLISVTEAQHHPYKDLLLRNYRLVPLFDKESLSAPRQKLPKVFRQNGAIYITSTKLFLKHKSFFISPVLPFFMDAGDSVDIDSKLDFDFAGLLLKRKRCTK